MSNKREQLLRKAIYCYQQVGMMDDVCRCLEKLGDYLAAARIHEQQQRWLPAAEAYRQAQAWLDAARCYWQCEHSFAEEAAECFVKAGERLQAAWAYAEGAQRFYRARLVLQQTPIETIVEEVSRDLILARCEAGTGSAQKAGFFVHNVLTRFPELPLGYRQRIENWAVTVAQHLSRFDLVATVYAIAEQGTLTLSDTWFLPSFWGLVYAPIVETSFLELAVSFLDLSPKYVSILSRLCHVKPFHVTLSWSCPLAFNVKFVVCRGDGVGNLQQKTPIAI